MTPGNSSETYSEHATLARYLGFLLVEGDDLAVSEDRLHVRTVAGLKRLDVLLRRIDSNFLDPLELDARSMLGVPGLIDVIRKGGVAVANMPGSGVMGRMNQASTPNPGAARIFVVRTSVLPGPLFAMASLQESGGLNWEWNPATQTLANLQTPWLHVAPLAQSLSAVHRIAQ